MFYSIVEYRNIQVNLKVCACYISLKEGLYLPMSNYHKKWHFCEQMPLFSKTSTMCTMAFFKLFYMVISNINIYQKCLCYGAKTGRKHGKFLCFLEKLNFFAYKFYFF